MLTYLSTLNVELITYPSAATTRVRPPLTISAAAQMTSRLIHIVLSKPLKEAGEHMVEVTGAGKTVKLRVVIEAKK